jgi:ABC-type sugar transport system substrate-binding protein
MDMFKRRSVMMGGLVTAAASSLTGVALAQAGKPTLVFVGHEL